jgi:hypothetical protein
MTTKLARSVFVLSVAALARADVRLFVTTSSDPYGLEDPANAFLATVSTVYANGVNVNGWDYWADHDGTIPGPIRPGIFPPADAPTGTAANPIEILPGDFAYVWLQYQNEPKGVRINGLEITVREFGTTTPAPVTTNWYLCNNTSNLIANKRWDGPATPPGYPEWHGNPQTFAAITAYGLQNLATNLPWNLWNGISRTALLGAIQASADGKLYELKLPEICYFAPTGWAQMAGGVFQFVPEPASGLLLALAAALARRR